MKNQAIATLLRSLKRWINTKRNSLPESLEIRPNTCSICGKNPGLNIAGNSLIQGHHHMGYEYPLEVRWVCPSCHTKIHAG